MFEVAASGRPDCEKLAHLRFLNRHSGVTMGRPFLSYESADVQDAVAREEVMRRWRTALAEDGCVPNATDPEVEKYLSWLYTLKRTAYTMVVERPDSELPRTASKVGGLPFLLPNEPWPCNKDEDGQPDPEGTEMTFIMQLRISEMPDDARALLGVEDGLMQLFFDDELPAFNINNDHAWHTARVITPEQLEGSAHTNNTRPQTARVLEEKLVVSWTQHEDWPNCLDDEPCPEELVAAVDGGTMSDIREILSARSGAECVGGDKIGGWPHWCQCPEWATVDGTDERYIHVLQLEAEHCPEISIGDSGTLVVQRHPREPNSFRVGWACC